MTKIHRTATQTAARAPDHAKFDEHAIFIFILNRAKHAGFSRYAMTCDAP